MRVGLSSLVQADLFYEEKTYFIVNSSKVSIKIMSVSLRKWMRGLFFVIFKIDNLLSKIGGIDFVQPKFWEFGDFSRGLSHVFNLTLDQESLKR